MEMGPGHWMVGTGPLVEPGGPDPGDFSDWVSLWGAKFIFRERPRKMRRASREGKYPQDPRGQTHALGQWLFVTGRCVLVMPSALAGCIWTYLLQRKAKQREARRMAIASASVTRARRRPRRGIAPGAPNESLCAVTSLVRSPTLGRACGWWLLHHLLSLHLLH